MKRLISARMNEIEKAFLRLFEGMQCISIYFPKITILPNAYDWGKQRRQVPAVTSRSFGLVIVDTESMKILCAIDFGFEDVPDQDLKRAVCKDMEVPYFVISTPAEVMACKQEIMQERRLLTVLGYGGRLNKHQYLTSMAFSLPEGRHGLGAHVLSEMSISSLISQEEFSHIVSKVTAEFADWDWRRDRDYLYQMDVDAIVVLGKPYSVPLFGFEYDGVSHGATEWSARKDQIKKEVFNAWGVPLIRLSSGGHAPGLVEDKRGRADLVSMCSKITERLVKELVGIPAFLGEIASYLNDDASKSNDPEFSHSLSGLAKLLELIKDEIKVPFVFGKSSLNEYDYDERIANASHDRRYDWMGKVSADFITCVDGRLYVPSPLMTGQTKGLCVSEEIVAHKVGGSTYRLLVKTPESEPDQEFPVERLDLKLATPSIGGVSQQLLDKSVLEAQREVALDKLEKWVASRRD